MNEQPESRLYEDVQTVKEYGTGLVLQTDTTWSVQDMGEAGDVSALEMGQRHKPDGTVEDYRRIEFREN